MVDPMNSAMDGMSQNSSRLQDYASYVAYKHMLARGKYKTSKERPKLGWLGSLSLMELMLPLTGLYKKADLKASPSRSSLQNSNG